VSKYDINGRPVVACDWGALADIPGLVEDLALLSISTGDLIVGNGANSIGNVAIGANGYQLTSNGSTAGWVNPNAGAGVVSTAYYQMIANGSPVAVSNSFTSVFVNMPVTNGVYSIFVEADFTCASGTSGFSTQLIVGTGGSGLSLAQAGGGVGFLEQETSGAYQQVPGNIAIPGVSAQPTYTPTVANYFRGYGRFVASGGSGATAVTLQFEANNAAGMTVNAYSYCCLTRIG
jgi:hypothetical protein